MEKNLIEKIQVAGLKGRGGGGFPVSEKWQALKKENGKKYVICNGAEGEPNGFKDGYILQNYLEDVLNGVSLAVKEFNAEKAYIYLRSDYYDKYREVIKLNTPYEVVCKPGSSYILGEETVVCKAIEGDNLFPKKKPPYLAEKGLFDCPTLMNNVESFYYISQISKGNYDHDRFYSLSGSIKNSGIYEFKDNDSIVDILKKTNNYPEQDFFIKAGGVSGEILIPSELDRSLSGAGYIEIFDRKTNCFQLMKQWAEFFHEGNCDKCTPCSEGFYLISQMAENNNVDFNKIEEILLSLKTSSFCALGKNAYLPFETLINKIIKDGKDKNKNR
jgi:NADH:ubiquinone oxidoreductase subunit F (NADH-binding)